MAKSLDALNLEQADPAAMHIHLEQWVPNFLNWWQQADRFPIPAHYVKVKKLVFSGMGGSGQAGAIVKRLALPHSRLPIELINDYTLPAWVDSDTLVIAVSHSGTTEETISTFIDAYEQGAKLIAIGTGGTIASLCRKYRVPYFEHTYLSQPRAALPVHLAIMANLVSRLGQLPIEPTVLAELTEHGERWQRQYSVETPTNSNPAKQLAEALAGRLPIIIGDGPLTAVAGRLKAQFNENAKSPAYAEMLPEMNHNALVGTEYPREVLDALAFVLLDSSFTHEQNKTRMVLTERHLKERRLWSQRFNFEAGDPLTEVIEATVFGDWVSYYTALLHQVDPTPVPGIADFKKSLEPK